MTRYSIFQPLDEDDHRRQTFMHGAARVVLDTAQICTTAYEVVQTEVGPAVRLPLVDTFEVIRDTQNRIRVVNPHDTFLFGWAALDIAWDLQQIDNRCADAVWWHSPALGWEVEAIKPGPDRERFKARIGEFVTANADLIASVTTVIVGSREEPWSTSEGYAWYRAGMLYVYET